MPPNKRPRLVLIDGSAQIFRAFHAIRHLSTKSGLPTNATYGYVQMLLKVVRDLDPEYLAVVFDRPEPTFRHEIFPEYKANRPAPPEDLVPQFDWIKKITQALNIPVLERPGLEADDIIGALAAQADKAGLAVQVVTGDKDFCQIVTENVTLLDTMKDQETGIEQVALRFGVEPARVIEVMGLMGDSSDNIPGVPGVGQKTAMKLIAEYGTIEGVYQNADQLKGKLGERIRDNRDQAFLSRQLVTIAIDAEVSLDQQSLVRAEPNLEELEKIFTELEFDRLREAFAPPPEKIACAYCAITDADELAKLIKRLAAAGRFAIDTETTSLQPTRADLVGLSFSCQAGEGFYIPVGHEGPGAERQLPRESVIEALRPLLADPKLVKIGQNIKYDLIVLERAGLPLVGPLEDTMLASYVLDPSRSRHNMDSLALDFLSRRTITYKEVAGAGQKQIPFAQVAVDTATDYAAEDAEITWCLAEALLPRLEGELRKLYEQLEMPLVEVLVEMEQAGVAVDLELFKRLGEKTDSELAELIERIYELAGEQFNLNSTQQLAVILFDKLGLPTGKKTKTGYSTNQEVLDKLAPDYDICRLLVDYRQASKLKSTYIDALPKLVHPETGRLHTSFGQAVAATGRLSSSDPNLQNIPIRTPAGRRIREGFVAPAGFVLVGADYSQIELRILAHVSGDENLIDSFSRGEDIHDRTAQQMFGLLPGMVTPDLRRQAKAINFGIVYGISAFGLTRQLEIDARRAQQLIDAYFAQYPGVRNYIDRTIEKVRAEKAATTLLGRRRPIRDIDAANHNVRQMAERIAVNTPIQGTAADLIKQAMIAIGRRLREEDFPARMILQIHDELLFETPEAAVEPLVAMVRREMASAAKLVVPLVVDIAVGRTWAEVH